MTKSEMENLREGDRIRDRGGRVCVVALVWRKEIGPQFRIVESEKPTGFTLEYARGYPCLGPYNQFFASTDDMLKCERIEP